MYRIFGLSVEVTRRCNFYCAHCLRGEPQDIDLDIDAFRCFVKENVQSIGTISLTGGEPTLALDQCEAVLRVLQEEDIPFDSFYISTNGSCASTRFLELLVQFFAASQDQDFVIEATAVNVSGSQFHRVFWDRYNVEENIKKLKAFAFTHVEDKPYKYVRNTGRAATHHLVGVIRRRERFNVVPVIEDGYEDVPTIEELHLDVKCNVYADCDLSYRKMKYYRFASYKHFKKRIAAELRKVRGEEEWHEPQQLSLLGGKI